MTLVGPRRNLCTEPVPLPGTRWISNHPITWVQVTGFDRPYAARITSTGHGGEHYILPVPGLTPVGQPCAVSISFRTDVATQCTAYILFYDFFGTVVGATEYASDPITTVAGQVQRIYVTGTPSGTAIAAGAQISTVSSSTAVLDATMAMTETGTATGVYFDGDSPGAHWDGLGATSTSSVPAPSPPSPLVPVADAYALYSALGPYTQGDAAVPGTPLLALCDAIGRMIQPVDDMARDQGRLPGWSQLVDVTRCPTSALPWLGQFAGVDVNPALSDSAQRTQITTQAAEGRGTPAAVLAAARAFVGPTATIRMVERDGGPYNITVSAFSQQLVGMTYNDIAVAYPTIAAFEAAYPSWSSVPGSSAEFVAAVTAAIPAGLVPNVNTSAHATYGDTQTAYPTITGFDAAFSTYALVAAWVPPS